MDPFNAPPANDHPSGSAPDRRQTPRQRVLLQGKIVYPHNSYAADCVIRDLSTKGARITVDPRALSAEPFLIVVRDGSAHRSLAVWSNPRFTGLRFQESHVLRDQVPASMQAIQRLWVDLEKPHQIEQQRWKDFSPR